MVHPRQPPSSRRSRFRGSGTSALAAGALVVVVALVVVLASPASEFASELLFDDPEEQAVEIESSDEQTAIATEAPAPVGNSRYIEGDVGFPTTLNPLLARTPSEQAVSTLLYRFLLGTDSGGDPKPDLAINWSVSEDGLTHTIELDPAATWHDGEPVTASDVLFTVSLLKDPEFPGDQDLSRFWRAITASQVDEHVIEFRLVEPYVGFGSYLRLPILPKHELGDILPEDLAEIDLEVGSVGSGPFAIEGIDRESGELRFVRAGNSNDSGVGEYIIRYFENRSAAIQAFRDGDVDGVSFVPLNIVEDRSALPGNVQIIGPEMSGYTALFFNIRHPYFRDTRTRQAIELSIDREALVETVLGGHASIGNSPIPSMSSAYQPGAHGEFDPEQARQLFEIAGWIEGDDGVLHRNDEPFFVPLIVNSDDPQRIAVANVLRQQLGEVGIVVEIQSLPSVDVQRSLGARQFTAALFGWHTDNGNLDCFQLWHSTQSEEGMNFTGFSDSEADEHLLAARRSVSIEERNQHYARFQEIFAEQVPAVVLFYPRYHFAVSERVQGVEPEPLVSPGDRVLQIPEWNVLE